MPFSNNPAKQFPFVRLLVALIAGIIIEWYFHFNYKIAIGFAVTALLFIIIFPLFSDVKKFSLNWLRGIAVLLLFVFVGMMITRNQNIQNNTNWFYKNYKHNDAILLTIEEPLVDKPKSYKALASVTSVSINNKTWKPTKGFILLYLKKDSTKPALNYGSQIIINKTLQPIQSSGNPASFNYKRFCLFQNITHQIFISKDDYIIATTTNKNLLQQFLFNARDAALQTMRNNIHSQKELGIAEALLIGYRNDLDKDLVQAYSNTGVVHIIAISGMHIAIIYATLIWLFQFFKSSKIKKWLEPIVILSIIWMFTLMAGAAPSISRAAVMFSCILIGKLLDKNSTIYNTLASSAFILLFYNPFYLWDVGFQLSYAAVLSIILFYKPVFNLIYIHNKLLQKLWQLTAVTLAAQVFALPLVIYHFHQFPLMFLLGNLIAVPISGLILYAELSLFILSWLKPVAAFIGLLIEASLKFMNDFVEYINRFRFSVIDGLNISLSQLIIVYVILILLMIFIFYKSKTSFYTSLIFIIIFFVLRDIDFIQHRQQQKLIVYNVAQHKAVDFIAGNTCRFYGDSTVITNAVLRNFNLKSSRIKSRLSVDENILLPEFYNINLNFNHTKILLLNKSLFINDVTNKIPVNIIIISDKIKNSITDLNKLFNCKTYIVTSNVSTWQSEQWKKDCEQLHLRFHSVTQQGAAVIKL